MENLLTGYLCIRCSREFAAEKLNYTCSCGANLDAVYDYEKLSRTWSKNQLDNNRDRSIWRYLPLLPVQNKPENTSFQVGGTPLVKSEILAQRLGLNRVYLKDETRNPSGSLKDRASEIAISHALEHNRDTLVAASTGNAAASLSILTANRNMSAVILAPASAPPAKLIQILQGGARLITIDGIYDQAFDLSMKLSNTSGYYSRSTGINPVLSEGKKTAALEIAEQLNWEPSDYVFVPAGDGCIIGGIYKGFYDLFKLGWIPRVPKLVAVQAKGSSAIVNALENGGLIQPVQADTLADSIQVDTPRDGEKALNAVRNSDGFGIRVSDDNILDAQYELSRFTGLFAEPAAAAAYAGLRAAMDENRIPQNSSVTLLITGTGLKDLTSAQRRIKLPEPVQPNLKEIDALLQDTI
ncbi:MAG: threonine synthase [FCB group bacterium]|nr:threonine synthase [FCB group bacterium]